MRFDLIWIKSSKKIWVFDFKFYTWFETWFEIILKWLVNTQGIGMNEVVMQWPVLSMFEVAKKLVCLVALCWITVHSACAIQADLQEDLLAFFLVMYLALIDHSVFGFLPNSSGKVDRNSAWHLADTYTGVLS